MTIKHKKSSTLHTRINKQINNNSRTRTNKTYNNNSSNDKLTDTNFSFLTINSKNSKNSKNNNKYIKKYKTFLTKPKTITKQFKKSKKQNIKKYSSKKQSKIDEIEQDKLAVFIDDNLYKLKNGHIIKGDILTKYFYNDDKLNCICENIYDNIDLNNDCNCTNMKTYSSQGKSGASIHSLQCSKIQNILKVLALDTYYMKLRNETKYYKFIELDGFTLQTIINSYIYKLLPNNSVNLLNSGICKKSENNKYKKASIKGNYHGYNLMTEADLGSGRQFLLKILEGKYDNEFEITNEDIRYKIVVSFLLQSILIIAQLQSSSLELCHGDYKPDNVFIKRCNKKKIAYYKFNAFGRKIKVKNFGFAVLIADFDKSSITINSDINNINENNTSKSIENIKLKYRFVPPIQVPILLSKYVNYIIKEYGDIDPDILNDNYTIKINKVFISKFVPIGNDPTISILRSAGIKLYRDFDIYTFMLRLLNDISVKEYIILKKLDTTILGFMSKKFKDYLFKYLFNREINPKRLGSSETTYTIVDIFEKINEPMGKIFTNDYFKILKNLNYHLFKK
jgi:hypothetical protein